MEKYILSPDWVKDFNTIENWLSGFEKGKFNPVNSVVNQLAPKDIPKGTIEKGIYNFSAFIKPVGNAKVSLSFKYLTDSESHLEELFLDRDKSKDAEYPLDTFSKTFDLTNFEEIISPNEFIKLKLVFKEKSNGYQIILGNLNEVPKNKLPSGQTKRVFSLKRTVFCIQMNIFSELGFENFETNHLKLSYKCNNKSICKTINTSYIVKNKQELKITGLPIYYEKRFIPWECDEQLVKFNTYSFDSIESVKNLKTFFESITNQSSAVLSRLKDNLPAPEAEYKHEWDYDFSEIEKENNLIKAGIEFLETDSDAKYAFEFVNETMSEKVRIKELKYSIWRPFQLAFILHNIGLYSKKTLSASMLNFPTGMGKTEAFFAYTLWLSAFLRLKNKNYGTTTIIKYPRVILSKQQGRRALEFITFANAVLLKSKMMKIPFSLGFLYGKADTPNRILNTYEEEGLDKKFIEAYENIKRGKKIGFEISLCPYCRKEVTTEVSKEDARILFLCKNSECTFSNKFAPLFERRVGEIPIYVTDDEVFRYTPTILLSTSYKFGTFSNGGRWKTLLGKNKLIDTKYGHVFYSKDYDAFIKSNPKAFSNKKLNLVPFLPPSLGIFDETHLLTGSSASLLGPIESAFIKIFSTNENFFQVICSSATINKVYDGNSRNYKHQISQLIGLNKNEIYLFPNELSVYKKDLDECQRMVIPVLPARYSQKFAIEKVSSYILSHCLTETNKAYINPLYYFNSKANLSSVRKTSLENRVSLIIGLSESKLLNIEELSADLSADELNEKMQDLEINSKFRTILATNIVANGLDAECFNLMLFFGLPKSNAEYVQARSRIARQKTNSGLAFLVLSRHSPREKTFYSDFYSWHENGEFFYEETPINKYSEGVVSDSIQRLFHLYVFAFKDSINFAAYTRNNMLEIIKNMQEDNNEYEKLCEFITHSIVSPGEVLRDRSFVLTKIKKFVDDYGKFLSDLHVSTIYRDSKRGIINKFLPEYSLLQTSTSMDVVLDDGYSNKIIEMLQ